MKHVLCALALVIANVGLAEAPVAPVKFGKLVAGTVAPDFTVVGVDGKEIKLSEFRGRTVVLNFWAPNRGPSESLQGPATKYADEKAVFLGVATGTTREEFDAWVAKTKSIVTYPLAWDPAGKNVDADIARKIFGIFSYPATGVIDPAGKVVGGFVGFGSQTGLVLRTFLRQAGLTIPPEETPAPPAGGPAPEPEDTTLKPGTTAPDFSTKDLGGASVKLSDFAGKIVVLDFWATWCGPCIASLPHTQKVAAETKTQGVVVWAACTSDARERFEGWMKQNAAKYPDVVFSHDPAGRSAESASNKLYNVNGIPTQFVIGRDGKILATLVGFGGESDHRLEDALAKAGVKIE